MMSEKLSEDEFRKVLYESLQKKGLVSGLKTHLRQQLTLHINQSNKKVEGGNRSELVGDLLTAAHLKYSHYDYTLSTYITEARISTEKYFTLAEWVRLLNISEESTLYRVLEDKAGQSPLISFLNAVVVSCGSPLTSISCQTESVTLQDKLHTLDQHYSSLPSNHFLPLEDQQLLQGFTDAKQTQEIIKLEIERFKELELERIKLVERDRCNKEFNRKVAELEDDYRQRLDGLHKRESDTIAAHDTLIRDTEASLYKDRQALLAELESLRGRSLQLEREKDLLKSQSGLEKEKMAVATARLEERGVTIAQREEDLENRLKEEGERVRLQCKAALRDREAQAAAKEILLQDESEERVRNITELEGAREQCTALRKESAALEDRCMMLEAQLDAARSQSLHLESKLTMLADYDQVKQRTVDLETERRHLLESVQKERSLAKQQDSQLHEIIASLREQLSRPSKTEHDAMKEMSKLKQTVNRDHADLKSQLATAHAELRREQQARLGAQGELREQFLQCRSNHVQAPVVASTKEFPDFLKRYLSSVNVAHEADASGDNDVSEHTEGGVSGMSSISTHSTGDSYYNPTSNIVASSRRVFEELEEEEAVLEREFEQFRKKTDVVMTPNVVEPDFSDLPKAGPESILKEKSVTFGARTEQYYTPSPQVPSSPADTAPALVQPRKPVQTKPVVQPAVQHQVQPLVQHQVQPPADSHIPQGVNPDLQKYMDKVLAARERPRSATPDKSTSVSEPVVFDKSDNSDFSW